MIYFIERRVCMNKFADDFDFYRSCVDQDEQVLWKGKPGKGRTLGSNGERFIVFGRFWLDGRI